MYKALTYESAPCPVRSRNGAAGFVESWRVFVTADKPGGSASRLEGLDALAGSNGAVGRAHRYEAA